MMLPRIVILEALLAHFRENVPELEPETPAFKVRHWRQREATSKEWPCTSLKFISDDPQGTVRASDGEEPSTSEAVFELTVELIATDRRPAEKDQADGGDEDDGEDPTGLGAPAFMLETLVNSLLKPGEPAETLGGLVWDILYDGSGEDEDDNSPDYARLADRITLLYRVRAEAPTHLLIGE